MVRRKTTGKGSELVKKRAARFKAIKARKAARKLRDAAARKRRKSTRHKDARIRLAAHARMRRDTAAAIKKVTGK